MLTDSTRQVSVWLILSHVPKFLEYPVTK